MSHTVLRSEWLPLTSAQLDFWEEYRLHPQQTFATVAHCTRFSGAVDVALLARAISLTLLEVAAFSLRFNTAAVAEQAQQRLDSRTSPCLQLIDLQQQPHGERLAMQHMREDMQRVADLTGTDITHSGLFVISPERCLWYLRTHHIIVDGYAMALIEHRVATHYHAMRNNTAAGAELGCFRTFHAEEQAYPTSDRAAKDRLFWQQTLPDIASLPQVKKGEAAYGQRALSSSQLIAATLSQQLVQLADHYDLSWPDVLIALSAAWLFDIVPPLKMQQDQRVMWMPVMNRRGFAAASVAALAVNTVPMQVILPPETQLADYLLAMVQQLKHLRRHAGYRLRQLGEDRGVAHTQRFFISPFINVQPFDAPYYPGIDTQRQVLAGGAGDGINLIWRANADGSNLTLDLDIFSAHCPQAAEAPHFAPSLLAFLQRAVQPGAQRVPVAALREHDNRVIFSHVTA